MATVHVLVDPASTFEALRDLLGWASIVDLAYAWAASSGGKADHWKELPLKKVRHAVIGIHFAQTEPRVLRELRARGVLRVVPDTAGVFHPKLIVGIKGNEARALVGSSNFTSGGFAGNTEANVLLAGPLSDPSLAELRRFIDDQWAHPRVFEPDESWLADYEALYARRPSPPRAAHPKKRTRVVRTAEDLEISWDAFFELIKRQERRALWTGWEIHVFDHPDGSYLQEVEGCREAFDAEPTYAQMPVEDRKLVAGWGDRTRGYYGRMRGAGYFKQLTQSNPDEIGKHLDKVPLKGPIRIDRARAYLEGIMHVNGVALGTATRLLCVKRPDLFLPANNASVKNIGTVFGVTPSSVDKYLQLTELIWTYPWFAAPEPKGEAARVWRARVALLDAIFYDPPDYLK